MIDRLGVQRLHDRDVVGDRPDVRQQFADPGTAVAVLGELENRRRDRQRLLSRGHAGDPLPHADRGGQLLAVKLFQLRLVIEQVDVRRPAGHEEVDDSFHLRRQMRHRQHAGDADGLGRIRCEEFRIHQRRQRCRADAGR